MVCRVGCGSPVVSRWVRTAAWLCAAAMGLAASPARPAAPETAAEAPTPLSGTAFEQALALPVGIAWDGVPLRTAVADLARLHRVAVLLDRRVDPERPLQLERRSVSLAEVVRAVAEAHGFDSATVGSAIVIGPTSAVRRLRTLVQLRADDVRRLPPERQQALLRRRSLAWPDLATPRDLLADLASEAGLRAEGLDRVPHDLWGQARLGELSWVERATLVANQYDLTFQLTDDGRGVRWVPVAEPVEIERRYPGGPQPADTARRWQAEYPNATVRAEGAQVVVRGPLEVHELLGAAGRPKPKPAPPKGTASAPATRYTLRVQNVPLARLVAELADKQGLPVELDRAGLAAAGKSPDVLVSVDVEEVDLDTLLRRAVEPAGLRVEFRGGRYTITAAP